MRRASSFVAPWALALGLLTAGRAHAICDCIMPQPAERLGYVQTVFEGTRVGDAAACSGPSGPEGCARYAFSVQRAWKGRPGRTVWVEASPSACGISPRPDEPWVIWCSASTSASGVCGVGPCSGSLPSSAAAAELKVLGEGYDPDSWRGVPGARAFPWAVAGVLVVSGVAAWRRSRRRAARPSE